MAFLSSESLEPNERTLDSAFNSEAALEVNEIPFALKMLTKRSAILSTLKTIKSVKNETIESL